MVFERSEPEFDTVILDPSYKLALGTGAIAILLGLLNLWAGGIVGLFAIFLAIQATLLRIHFTDTALDLYRGEKRLRTFPYKDWTYWEIYWPRLPILFFFNEVNNIHFVPMLFNPQQLADCATERCPCPSEPDADGNTAGIGQVEESAPAKASTSD